MITLLACVTDTAFIKGEEAAETEDPCVPSAEVCNDIDDDCDALVDDADPDVTGEPSWFSDDDGDGHGDADDSTTFACDPGEGWSTDNYDCDDANVLVSPSAIEVCNDVDDDCDGLVDGKDDSLSDATTWYRDKDGDGYGDPNDSEEACKAPPSHVATGEDCDDTRSDLHPGAIETCDGEDDDCDGEIDEDAIGDTTWYADTDGDGYGDADVTSTACDPGEGWVSNGRDPDDGDAAIGPDPGEDDGTLCPDQFGVDLGDVPSFAGVCDANFVEHSGHCYFAVDTLRSWNDARATCAAAGGYLAVTTDRAESEFVFALTDRTFVGGCDGDVEGTWTWLTGEPWSYTDFATGEPNDSGGTEECLEITATSTGWNDIWCTYNSFGQGYVCEFEP